MKEKQEKEKEENKREAGLITRESVGAVGTLFSLLAFFIVCTRSWIFGDIGAAIASFLFGVFGYSAFAVLLGAVYFSVTLFLDKRFIKNRKALAAILLGLICIGLIIHAALTYSWDQSGYLTRCFQAASTNDRGDTATVMGWLGGLVVFAFSSFLSRAGAIVLFAVLLLFCIYLALRFIAGKNFRIFSRKSDKPETPESEIPTEPAYTSMPPEPSYQNVPRQTVPPQSGYSATPEVYQRPEVSLRGNSGYGGTYPPKSGSDGWQRGQGNVSPEYENPRDFLFGATPQEFYQKNLIFDRNANVNKRSRSAEQPTNSSEPSSSFSSYASAYTDSVNGEEESKRPQKILADDTENNDLYDPYALRGQPDERSFSPVREELPPPMPAPMPTPPPAPMPTPMMPIEPPKQEPIQPSPVFRVETPQTPSVRLSENTRKREEDSFPNFNEPSKPATAESVSERTERTNDERRSSRRGLFDAEDTLTPRRGEDFKNVFDDEEESDDLYSLKSDFSNDRQEASEPSFRTERTERISRREEPSKERVAPEPKPKPVPPPPKPKIRLPYRPVPLDYFDCRDVIPDSNVEEVEEIKSTIVETLEAFKVNDSSVASVTFGPTVTRYNVVIPRNISAKKVVALDQEIAMNLRAGSGVNIYPNLKDGAVSIEVPNKKRQFVQLGCMLTGDEYVNAKSASLMFAIGKDVANRKVYGDICKMTHLLVAGSSGSGKSVFLGSLIISLIAKYSPEQLRLILIDPKKTEFVLYNKLPHLMIDEIITDVNKTIQSLNWAIGEMNRRYALFEGMSRAGTYVVNIDEYNANLPEGEEKLPKIVIIVDELADLMLAAKKEIEDRIQSLTQKSRAAGIHLIIATQRPSTDVITGVIKSNLPTRFAFMVASEVDSRVILDMSGAQKLLGKGDMLYTMAGINTPVRVQSAFISSEDSQKVVNYIKMNNEANFDEGAMAYINNSKPESSGGDDSDGEDEGVEEVYIEALRYVIQSGSASISMIQRKCSVGYNKAGKISEWMEDMGYISSFDGAKARKVLISKEEFEEKYGPL